MGNDTRQLSQAAVEAISARLAQQADLRVPAQLRQGESTDRRREEYLSKLLTHDPGVFLERHGSSLTAQERREFEGLRGDYEVDFFLKLLEDQADPHKHANVAKNRRLAYMNRLVAEGSYFSEREMRERQPGLHHQYIGQFRPPEVPLGDACQAGCVLAESIMRQQAELDLRQRQALEQRQWDQQEQESEQESAEEEEEEAAAGGGGGGASGGMAAQPGAPAAAAAAAAAALPAGSAAALQQQQQQPGGAAGGSSSVGGGSGVENQAGGAEQEAAQAAQAGKEGEQQEAVEEGPAYVHISEEEQQENAAALLDAMKQRFLSGLDAGIDYAAIDADAELDEDWADVQRRDAEDRYFDDGD